MKRTILVIEDDLDKTEIASDEAEPTMLALNHDAVLLDLTPGRRAELAELLAPYLAAGKPVVVPVARKLTELPLRRNRRGSRRR